jgi:hypothetical protein
MDAIVEGDVNQNVNQPTQAETKRAFNSLN